MYHETVLYPVVASELTGSGWRGSTLGNANLTDALFANARLDGVTFSPDQLRQIRRRPLGCHKV